MEFSWEPVHHNAFCKLKQLLISAPVLAFPDCARGFILENDASGVGLGAILAQSHKDGMVHPLHMLVEHSSNMKKIMLSRSWRH